MKFLEGYVLKYLNFQIFQYPIGFSVDHTNHIMEIVNEWFTTGKFRKVDTPFRKDSTYEKELMAALTLTGNALHKAEMEYYGKFGYTLGMIRHIALMSTDGIYYATCRLATHTVAPTITGFQGIKCCVQYLARHPYKPIFILIILMMDQISSDLYGVGIMLNTTPHIIVYVSINIGIMLESSTSDGQFEVLFILCLVFLSA